jgi:hypothetical protein
MFPEHYVGINHTAIPPALDSIHHQVRVLRVRLCIRLCPQQVAEKRMKSANSHVVIAWTPELPVQQKKNIREIAHDFSRNFGFVDAQSVS